MIYEYAVDPELVATWYERRTARYFRESFGLGTPRVISRFPSKWKQKIWQAFHQQGIEDDNAKLIVSALIQAISENMIGRPESEWQEHVSWIENAVAEHQRSPFKAILTKETVRGCPEVITERSIDSNNPNWAVSLDHVVQRSPQALSEIVGPMLCMARKIIFVDYMLNLESNRYKNAVASYLGRISAGRPNGVVESIEIITSDRAGGVSEYFREKVMTELPRLIPNGLKVRVWRVRARPDGVGMHNRYILTNCGGVKFGWGLDSGRNQDDDDISIFGKEAYGNRWQRYSEVQNHFDIDVGPLDVSPAENFRGR